MEVKPTIFSVVGFLVPGIVLMTLLVSLLGVNQYGSLTALVAALPIPRDGIVVLVTTVVIASGLAITLAAGAVLSDASTFVARQLILRPLVRSRLRDSVTRLFAHDTLESLIKADMDARESYVYINSSGLDLDWYAGRLRMMGASGSALLIGAVLATVLDFSYCVSLSLLVVSLIAIGVALYRWHKFDEYVAATAAVLARRGAKPREPSGKALAKDGTDDHRPATADPSLATDPQPDN